MNGNPKISVVIPTYNRKESLEKCLSALVNQSFKDFEVIVVSDGSTDGTDNMIKKFFKKLNLKYRNIGHKGRTIVRNKGIELSKAPIIAFTDDDCIPDKNWLKNALGHFNKESVVGVMGKTIFNDKPYFNKDEIYAGYLTCNMFYRKDILEKINGFDSRFAISREDTDLAWKVMKFGEINRDSTILVNHPNYHGKKPAVYLSYDVLLYKEYPKEYILFAKEGGCGFIKYPYTWRSLFEGKKKFSSEYPFFRILFIELFRFLNSKLRNLLVNSSKKSA